MKALNVKSQISQELGERHIEKEIKGQKRNTFILSYFSFHKIFVAGAIVISLVTLLQVKTLGLPPTLTFPRLGHHSSTG